MLYGFTAKSLGNNNHLYVLEPLNLGRYPVACLDQFRGLSLVISRALIFWDSADSGNLLEHVISISRRRV